MSNLTTTSPGYISPVGDYALKNSQALGGVSHLWQDFFARAMQDQQSQDSTDVSAATVVTDVAAEPTAGSDWLAQVNMQRLCDVKGTEVKPPEPLFLPIAEFDTDLLDKAAPPFSADELTAQQKQLDFDSGWVRPLVLNAGQDLGEPGPAPRPRALNLPIAEFEWELADKPAEPYDSQTLARQQTDLDFDHHWAAPVVVQNLRISA
ncbi:energy transducer TonB [Pseudomonas sp. dw_358]|uniref:energy transducer TonB n=1 Tax=Pseudomonas sp. dw_358 TaxID=2720083 RepID=UPI001BD3D479|nr:energy transducer TonB [Pseudomonas sp. dw_358]